MDGVRGVEGRVWEKLGLSMFGLGFIVPAWQHGLASQDSTGTGTNVIVGARCGPWAIRTNGLAIDLCY